MSGHWWVCRGELKQSLNGHISQFTYDKGVDSTTTSEQMAAGKQLPKVVEQNASQQEEQIFLTTGIKPGIRF
jgi:hypothetical protein